MAIVAGSEPFASALADGAYGSGWNGIGAASYLGHAGQGVTGLLHGDARQFLCQLMGATLCAIWAFGATYGVFTVVNKIKSMRVAPEVELEGLDVPEFGMKSYPEDAFFGRWELSANHFRGLVGRSVCHRQKQPRRRLERRERFRGSAVLRRRESTCGVIDRCVHVTVSSHIPIPLPLSLAMLIIFVSASAKFVACMSC